MILRRATVCALMAIGTLVVVPSAAGALEPKECIPTVESAASPVTIHTMPVTPNFKFTLDKQQYTTGADGKVTLQTFVPCGVTERLTPDREPVPITGGARAVFQRWYGRGAKQTATFVNEYQVTIDYQNLQEKQVDPDTLDKVVLRSSLGVHLEQDGGETAWLMGRRVVPSAVGLELKDVYWTVDTVEIGGLNIVNRSQYKFFPEKDRSPAARLLFFTAKIRARDAFFGFSMGSKVKLEYPNGRVEMHDLDDESRITIAELPRGEYQITARGPGLRLSRPVAITKDQEVDLKILSYLDLAVVALAALAFSIGLVVLGHWRRARRSAAEAQAPASSGHLARV